MIEAAGENVLDDDRVMVGSVWVIQNLADIMIMLFLDPLPQRCYVYA